MTSINRTVTLLSYLSFPETKFNSRQSRGAPATSVMYLLCSLYDTCNFDVCFFSFNATSLSKETDGHSYRNLDVTVFISWF
jgi:hypothetical protein